MCKVLTLLLLAIPISLSSGCDRKPDPRKNPEFSEESYNDVDAVTKQMRAD